MLLFSNDGQGFTINIIDSIATAFVSLEILLWKCRPIRLLCAGIAKIKATMTPTTYIYQFANPIPPPPEMTLNYLEWIGPK